jgi:hypothetical protein
MQLPLSGIRLMLARTLWLALVVPSLGFAVAGFPLYYQQLQRPCSNSVTCNFAGALTAQGLRAFAAIAFSASGYAAFNAIFWASILVIWSGIGLLIFWRRSDDWFALLAAFALIMFNTTFPGFLAPRSRWPIQYSLCLSRSWACLGKPQSVCSSCSFPMGGWCRAGWE